MSVLADIERLIPHRAPFLFVDSIVSLTEDCIVTRKHFAETLDFYKGHYPGNPITPGVILSEAIFQSGALLLAQKTGEQTGGEGVAAVPVLTRVTDTKYKRTVPPNSDVEIEVRLVERVASAWFMKGVLRTDGKVAVRTEFACAMADVS